MGCFVGNLVGNFVESVVGIMDGEEVGFFVG